MKSHLWKPALVAAVALASMPALVTAQEPPKQYDFEIRLFQVLTSISGDGLTSQTLPGVNGSFQVLHQALDGVKLVMDGDSLTWDGKDAPDNPRIVQLSAPRIVTLEKTATTLLVKNDDKNQYFERKENGLFELKTVDSTGEPIGILIVLTPHAVEQIPDQLNCDFRLRYTWIKDREPIEGVSLQVGKPIIDSVATQGKLGCKLGQWTCYQTTLTGEGTMYFFVRPNEFRPNESGEKL